MCALRIDGWRLRNLGSLASYSFLNVASSFHRLLPVTLERHLDVFLRHGEHARHLTQTHVGPELGAEVVLRLAQHAVGARVLVQLRW